MALLGTSIAAAGGGTKHRVKRNRRRTVKAAATYGAAYRKYNRMYGGATDDPLPAPPAPTDEENKPGMWERLKNLVTPGKKEGDAEEQKQAPEPEEPGLFAKANAKVQETVKETVATAENVANTAETALQNTKDRVSKAADAVKQTASAVGTTLETSGALVKNQIGSAIDTIDADAAKPENAKESNDAVEEKKPDAADAPDANASESTSEVDMTDDKRRIKELEERIRKMTSGTIAKAIEAAEQATGSVEDALKALQLAFIASKTVIAAGKAALVANSGNDEEAVLSQGADVESQPEPKPEPASADTEPVAEQEQEAPVKDEGDSDASDSSSVSSDSDASSETSSDDGAVPAAEPEPEPEQDAAAAVAVAEAAASSEPVVKDDIPPETVEPQTGEAAQPQTGEMAQQPQTDASKAADALNSETDNKKMGGKKHKHKTKNSAVVNNRTRRAN